MYDHVSIPEGDQEAPFMSGIEALPFVLTSMPPQVVGNACSLLQLFANVPSSDARTALVTATQSALSGCAATAPPEVRTVVVRARQLLN